MANDIKAVSQSVDVIDQTAVAKPISRDKHEVLDTPAPISARGTIIAGLSLIVVTFFGAGVWAATAPLASAVTAPGTVVFAGKRRIIQHLEGGIVKELHVLEGDEVKTNQLLITLDETPAKAMAARLRTQLDTQLALESRLMAEQASTEAVLFPKELTDRTDDLKVAQIVAGQRQEFEERRKTLVGTIDLLQQKISQLGRTIEGLQAQQTSKKQQVVLITEELSALQQLLRKGLTPKPRLLELQRMASQLDGDIGDIGAQMSRSDQQISEAKMQIIQSRQTFREDVTAQLRNAEARVSDLRQQLLVAEDVSKRLKIFAPQSGTIQNLAVSTIGGVIGPGQTLMEIAPKDGDFLVEAQVSPIDIDSVTIGQDAEVRFSALDLRTTPVITGKVVSRSGDRIVEQSNRPPYYRVQVRTSPEEMAKLQGRALQAGMPAEVLISTGDRTLAEYITKPLTDQIARGMNEQ